MRLSLVVFRLWQLLRHKALAKTRYGVHSPFIYTLISNIVPPRPTPLAEPARRLARQLRENPTVLHINDFGAGPSNAPLVCRKQTISAIVKRSGAPRRKGELLHRLVAHFAPDVVLEFGTNLGLSAAYMATALQPGAKLVSVEGAPQLAVVAQAFLRKLGSSAAEVAVVNQTFEQFLAEWPTLAPKLFYLDGHHTHEATLRYCRSLAERVGSTPALFILDDIYWSPGMARAWLTLCAEPWASVSVDLFDIGLLFLNWPQAKAHFKLQTGVLNRR